jgi:flavin reductase (DIM6/NTAB) family NADH-FMN oxidoreductase RutF
MTSGVHRFVSELDYPMFIVTVTDGTEKSGCLVGFATQCSVAPARFLVCISDKNHTFGVVQRAEVVVVHLVPEDATGLAELFGSQTGDEIDKFERCSWTAGPEGTPILDDIPNWFAGRILERISAGDHCALLLDPFDAHAEPGEGLFAFHRARAIPPGHDP